MGEDSMLQDGVTFPMVLEKKLDAATSPTVTRKAAPTPMGNSDEDNVDHSGDDHDHDKKRAILRRQSSSTVMDFRENERPRWRLIEETMVTFLILHYIQVFWVIIIGLSLMWSHGVRWPLLSFLCVYVPLYLVPWQRLGGRYSVKLAQRPFWARMQRHLKVQVEREVELDPSKQYIFGFHPHGILLLSRVAIYGGIWEKLFPGIEMRTLAASPLFFMPPIREVTILLGGVDASRAYAERVLRDGYSVSVYPGGSKEIFTTDPDSPATRLILKSRKGFIKLALQHGTPLVPVYVFGEKYAYSKLDLTGFRKWLLKNFRWFTFMPKEGTTLSLVVGEPIEVPKTKDPSDALVTQYQQKYIQALQDLFDRHKDQYGQKGEYLVIE